MEAFYSSASASRNKGFTLVELIASLLLMGLLTAVLGMGLVAAIQGYDYNRANVEVAQKAQIAMARMTRELQELVAVGEIHDAGQDPFVIYDRIVETNGRPVRHTFGLHFNPADSRLRLYTDLDQLGSGVPAALSNSTIADGDILIDNVRSFSLQFFQGRNNWPEEADINLLSAIEITLQINRPDDPGKSETFRTLIHPRNTGNVGGATI